MLNPTGCGNWAYIWYRLVGELRVATLAAQSLGLVGHEGVVLLRAKRKPGRNSRAHDWTCLSVQ